MRSLEKNLFRLFGNRGKLFLVALDHPQYFGPVPGLEDTIRTAEVLLESPADGFILNPGVLRRIDMRKFFRKVLVVRASVGGSKFGKLPQSHPVFLPAESALALGADAVILMMVVGGNDVESIYSVGKNIEGFHKFGLPVIVEILTHDPSKMTDTDVVATGARIAGEIGADVVKAFYTEDMEKVVRSANVPVILAGGPKTEKIEEVAKRAVKAGVKGFAFGRNVFGSGDPVKTVEILDGILRG